LGILEDLETKFADKATATVIHGKIWELLDPAAVAQRKLLARSGSQDGKMTGVRRSMAFTMDPSKGEGGLLVPGTSVEANMLAEGQNLPSAPRIGAARRLSDGHSRMADEPRGYRGSLIGEVAKFDYPQIG